MRGFPVIAIALVLLGAPTVHAATSSMEGGYGRSIGPDGYGVFAKGVRFIPHPAAPVACEVAQDGLVSMTAAHRFCVCDGKAWRFLLDPGQPCEWQRP